MQKIKLGYLYLVCGNITALISNLASNVLTRYALPPVDISSQFWSTDFLHQNCCTDFLHQTCRTCLQKILSIFLTTPCACSIGNPVANGYTVAVAAVLCLILWCVDISMFESVKCPCQFLRYKAYFYCRFFCFFYCSFFTIYVDCNFLWTM